MYDDSGAIVSEVVLKDRIHMATEGMFVVVLTIQKGTGRLLTSPDIISRGFIYLRDSEELMSLIKEDDQRPLHKAAFTGQAQQMTAYGIGDYFACIVGKGKIFQRNA